MLTSLGQTGLVASRMGLGLASLGRPGYINIGHGSDLHGHRDEASMEQRAHNVLNAAYAAGVRYFDAARSYGRAESFLASWLEHRQDLGDVTVGSKWGYTYTADWRVDAPVPEVKELSAANLRRQFTESRSALGPWLRLYQIHSATLESGVLEDAAVLEELALQREKGLAIGLSVTGSRQSQTIRRALEIGGFDTVQATWNLLERSAEPALVMAHAAGLGVIIKEALANGRLTSRGDIASLREAAVRLGTTPDALALGVALAQPWADVTLSGATTVAQLESNVGALALRPSVELTEELDAIRENPVTYWHTRAALPWN